MSCQCEMVQEATEEQVDRIVARHKDRPGPLIPVLDEVQSLVGWLPKWSLVRIAKGLDLPTADVYGVASFYHFFKLVPPGKVKVQVCMGTACYVRGSQQLLDSLERRLGIKAGETTGDRKFTLESVRCVGACSLAPVIVTGEDCHASMTTTKIDKMLKAADPEPAN